MRNEPDYQLLELMSRKSFDEKQARAAWEEFFIRHRQYLYDMLKQVYRQLCHQSLIEDIVQETFMVVYFKSDRFCPSHSSDPDHQRHHLLGWLGSIARRLFETARTSPSFNLVELSEEIIRDIEEGQTSSEPTEPSPDNEKLALVREALACLSERERRILALTGEYFDARKQQQRVSHKELSELAQEFGITASNIRQIRKRAKDKVLKYIQSRYPQSA